MKIIGTFAVVVTASIALLQPAEGRPRGSGHSFSAPRFSSGGHYSNRSYSAPSTRYSAPTARYSSQPAYRNRTYSRSAPRYTSRSVSRNRVGAGPRDAVDRNSALNPKFDSRRFDSRPSGAGTTAARSRGYNNGQGRVSAQHTRNWNRKRDYHWRGNRCRWRNNSWVIIGPWFYPWGYGYYPYASYSYYDDRYYDDRYATSESSQSEYDQDSSVSQVQAALAREGYYHGSIDGSVGPETRNALRRYQQKHGLEVTGRIDQGVIEALGLG